MVAIANMSQWKCALMKTAMVNVESIPPETWTFPNTPIIQTEMDWAKIRAQVSR